jgi:hypothetical protein
MRDRLIDIIRDIFHTDFSGTDEEGYADFADKLLANGVILPPCKVGDKIYFISIYNKVEEYIVKGICQYPNGLFVEINYLGNSYTMPIDKAFLTKSQAEQKLKELSGNG